MLSDFSEVVHSKSRAIHFIAPLNSPNPIHTLPVAAGSDRCVLYVDCEAQDGKENARPFDKEQLKTGL